MSKARKRGESDFILAYNAGVRVTNPYTRSTREFIEWNFGYLDAQYDLDMMIGGGNG